MGTVIRPLLRIFSWLCFLTAPALAVLSPQPDVVIQVANVAALQAGHFNGASAINLGGYYTLQDGGGGTLKLDNTCTVDNGLCFQTAVGTGDKYRRVNPKWTILEWGGKPDWSTDASSALTAMLSAATTAHQPQVSMAANSTGSGYNITSLITVPSGVNVDCGAAPYVQPGSDDFRSFPSSLLLVNSGGIKFSGSGISNCNLINNTLATAAPPTDIQGAYARLAAFSGTGIQCIADGCPFVNDSVIGFTTGITYTGAIRNYNVSNVRVDATTCYAVKQGQENRQQVMDQAICQPLATTNATTGTVPDGVRINLNSVTDNGSGEDRLNFSSCVTTSCPLEGYQAWVVNGSSDQSIQGGWTLHNVTSTHADLQGSSSAYLSGATVSMTTVSGSTVVTAAATLSSQVKATQTISGTCIPAAATIKFVEKVYNLIFISAPATCAGTNNMTITDAASGHFTITTATPAVAGTNYAVGDVLTVSGGTVGTGPAIFTVATIDGSGGVASVSITDGGDYTVIPASPASVTGGTGTGATFTVADNTTGQLLLTANSRTGACYSFFQTNDVVMTDGHCYAHAIGLLAQNNTTRVKADQVIFDDAGILQDDTRICVHFTGSSGKNQVSNFKCDNYFGHGIVDDSSHSSPVSGNSVVHGLINSNSNAGFNQALVEVSGPSSGTAKKAGFIFSDITSGATAGLFLADDISTVSSSANLMKLGTFYSQTAAAVGNYYSDKADQFLAGFTVPSNFPTTAITAHAGGGQASATLLPSVLNIVATVATDGDSVILEPAPPHWCVTVANTGNGILAIYANGSDTIDGLGAGNPRYLASGSVATFCSFAAAKWRTSQTNPSIVAQVVNLNTVTGPAAGAGTTFQSIGSDGNPAGSETDSFAGIPRSIFRRANTTAAAPSTVQANNTLMDLGARPYDGTAYTTTSTGSVQASANENFSATNHGTDIIANCTLKTTTTTAECFRARADGLMAPGTIPVVTGTGSPAIATGSTDTAGKVTGGTNATSIVITFATVKTNAPFCTVSPQTSVASFAYTVSTTAITITQTATTGQIVNYTCIQD